MKHNKSFTLIELLVVIAIIGILSSIVLVSTRGVREKARVAKSLEFSQSLQNALGFEAVGIWNFDEGSGTVAKDGSGYGNDGSISGASYTDDTPHKIVNRGIGRYALSFDGADDFVDVGNDASLDITGAVTAEAWVKFNNQGYSIYVSKGIYPNYNYKLNVGDGAKFEFVVGINGAQRIAADPDVHTTGDWYHQVGTFDGCWIKLYINGILKDSTYYCGTTTKNSNPVILGKYYGGGNFLNGYLDEVRIYSQALSAFEIQKHYAEGLETHKNRVSIRLW